MDEIVKDSYAIREGVRDAFLKGLCDWPYHIRDCTMRAITEGVREAFSQSDVIKSIRREILNTVREEVRACLDNLKIEE